MTVDPTELLGGWRLDRRLIDRVAGHFGRMSGRLELTRVATGVRWVESGRLQWCGATLAVTRELFLEQDGEQWQVRFGDGRPFHPWTPGRWVQHPCRADLYRGLIVADRAGARLRVRWDVQGPGKEQRILTRCVRTAALSQAAAG